MRVAVVGTRLRKGKPHSQERAVWAEARRHVRRLVWGFSRDHDVLVSGGAPGIDTFAEEAAREAGVPVDIYLAAWERPDGTVNKAAGFERNTVVVDAADSVVAFWDGKSRGTADTLRKAIRAGKSVYLVSIPSFEVVAPSAIPALVGVKP